MRHWKRLDLKYKVIALLLAAFLVSAGLMYQVHERQTFQEKCEAQGGVLIDATGMNRTCIEVTRIPIDD